VIEIILHMCSMVTCHRRRHADATCGQEGDRPEKASPITGYLIALKSLREASVELDSLLNTGHVSLGDITSALARVYDHARAFRTRFLREVAKGTLSPEGNREA
jgi:hypothetical protein